MGVSSGHRELCSNHSLQEQRRFGERASRQENPIVHEPSVDGSTCGRPPSGNLRAGLVPAKGPLDHMTQLDRDKDVPCKRLDPTRNRSASLGPGVCCVPLSDSRPRAVNVRITGSSFGEGLGVRETTPERRRVPGQVLRSGVRPKDSLSGGGCVASDRAEHPLNLPRKAGSAGAGVGSGGSVHLVAGPTGFVPMGPADLESEVEVGAHRVPSVPFTRACGIRCASR